ncbi:MAG: four helix bundle protein [Caldilineales bacterium]|nr:four helix bundle protein [Caldilineales bacterium]MDW8316614.1 four helix bundle protein [Anaerolineae bacterium]
MAEFRFQNLEIWKRAVTMAHTLFDLADKLEEKRLYRFAEQLRGAALSVPNNIAEGSGSESAREFDQFLGFARRSIYETANMLYIFADRKLVTRELADALVQELEELSRMITGFRRSLR